jgi:hypothetical protein
MKKTTKNNCYRSSLCLWLHFYRTQSPIRRVPGALSLGVKVTNHLHLVPRLRTRGAIPPLSKNAFMACSAQLKHKDVTFIFTCNTNVTPHKSRNYSASHFVLHQIKFWNGCYRSWWNLHCILHKAFFLGIWLFSVWSSCKFEVVLTCANENLIPILGYIPPVPNFGDETCGQTHDLSIMLSFNAFGVKNAKNVYVYQLQQ